MSRATWISKEELHNLATSPSVQKFGREIVAGAAGRAILDAPCGAGRNSAWLSYLGGRVIGLDIDLRGITKRRRETPIPPFGRAFRRLKLLEMDLINDPWPYPPRSLGGVINIHFLHMPLLAMFSKSMLAGGFLVLETVEARGGNYHQLPKSGCIREILGNTFSFLIYKEQSAGPAGVDAVTVKLVARKLAFPR
jgi:SAM-dependent methyltransferase